MSCADQLPATTPPGATPDQTWAPLPAGRRRFLQGAGGLLAAAGLGLGPEAGAQFGTQASSHPLGSQDYVQLSQVNDPKTEAPEKAPGPFEAPDNRIGFAIVGLGRLSIDQILPAFGKSKLCKPVALVSGDAEKARKIGAQYGIEPTSLYSYETFDTIAHNPEVKVVYIVLPNSMHLEYTVRSAKAGKHVLSEKPMAVSAAECER